jgi:hypothetical protein
MHVILVILIPQDSVQYKSINIEKLLGSTWHFVNGIEE